MPLWNEYHLANSIQDALTALMESKGDARIISGGTDLLLDIQQGRHPPVHTLVDVSCISEMNRLEIENDYLFIGAALPLNEIIKSELVFTHAQSLVEACSLIGGPQVRNAATLGGNVGHALPAGDGTIALLSLGADAQIANLDGGKRIKLDEFFVAPGKSCLDLHQEFIIGFQIPISKRFAASAFKRVMRPQGVAIAILNMGVYLERKGDKIKNLRIAVGPSGPIPKRAITTEKYLLGKKVDTISITKAKELLQAESTFRTSLHRSSAEYRRHLSGILLEEVLMIAWKRAESPNYQLVN